jgi:poly-gamma-glutamate synthesis protein (capsule biosynthesis protein)
MNRRRFIRRSGAAFAALSAPRWLHAAAVRDSMISMPAPPESFDSLRYQRALTPADTTLAPGPAITLAVGGDTTLAYNLEDHFDQQLAAGRSRDELVAYYFAGVRAEMATADLRLVNLECALTEHGKKVKKNFNFRGRPELVDILRAGSVDAVTCANNHARDYGDRGVRDTLDTLDHAGIAHFGSGKNLDAARQPLILERNGLKIGFLGYYFQIADDMIEPDEVYATKHHAGPAGVYEDLDAFRAMLEEDVQALVPQVDFAVPYFHWGKEGVTEVRPYQIELAHRCIDLGCRAVLGSHPHRFHGVELYRDAPIAYSLGNFVYGGIKEPKDLLSALVRLRFTKGAPPSCDLVPVHFTRWPDAPFQPVVLAGAEREEALREIARRSAGFTTALPQLQPYLGGQQLVPDR